MLYEIVANSIYKNGKKETLVSLKKFKTYEEAKKEAKNLVKTIPEPNIVLGFYVRKADEKDY